MSGTKSSRKLDNAGFTGANNHPTNPSTNNPFATDAEIDALQVQIDNFTGGSGNYIISGNVSWSGSGLIYDVTTHVYVIQGTQYTSAATQVTLTSDPTDPQYWVVYADSTGSIGTIAGTPAPVPVPPSVDGLTQIVLATILVPAGATVPVITEVTVYDENAGTPTEWAGTSDDTNVNFASTNDPFQGTISIETNLPLGTNREIILTPASAYTIVDPSTLVFQIKAKVDMSASTGRLYIGFFNGGSLVGNAVYIGGTTLPIYGFDATDTSGYQIVSIPIAAFGVLPATVDALRFFKLSGSSTANFFLDDVHILEGGAVATPPFVGVSGSGTLDYVPKWTPDGTTLGDSQIRDDGDTVAINGAPTTDYQLLVFNDTDDRYAIAGVATANSVSNVGVYGAASLGPSNIAVFGLADGGTSGIAIAVSGIANVAWGSFPSTVAIGGSFSAGVDGVPGDVYGVRAAAAGSNPDNNIALYAQAVNPGAGSHWAAQFVDGTEGAGKVWTSDALGRGTWQTPSGGGSGSWEQEQYAYNMLPVSGTFNGVSAATAGTGTLFDIYYFRSFAGVGGADACYFNMILPDSYTPGTGILISLKTTVNSTGGDVKWVCGLRQPTAGQQFGDDTNTEYVSGVVTSAANWPAQSVDLLFSDTGLTAGDPISIIVYRDPGDAADTDSATAYLNSILVREN